MRSAPAWYDDTGPNMRAIEVSRGLTIYNQTVLSDDDFVLNFVARHNVLETLLRCLRTADRSGGQHHLLVGSRGMGKTSLLRRLAIAVDRDEKLSSLYVPLSFREEQYNVLKLDDFWRNCGEALAEWAEGKGRIDFAESIDAALAGPDWSDAKAGEAFEKALADLGRRAVLLVDNLDLILDNLSDEDNWKLRRALQRRGGPIIVGAATQLLTQSGDRDAAFYEFFQPHYLEPLDAHETEACMRALARVRGSNGAHVVRVLDTQPERLRTLHTLTGGNPRVLALIYRLLESAESDAAMADLELLLDQVTPYYKARVEEYQGAQQRAVIDAIALHWDPITTGELSNLTNIASTTLSPLLIRLRKDGLIESVETSGSYSGHQLVERFFNIWYLMRHGTRRAKQKMRWLVAFLTSFYSNRELEDILKRARLCGDAMKWHADYTLAFEEALSRSALMRDAAALQIAAPAEGFKNSGIAEASELLSKANDAFQADDLQTAHSLYTRVLKIFDMPETPLPDRIGALAMVGLAGVAAVGDDFPEAMRRYEAVLNRYQDDGDPSVRRAVLGAMLGRAVVLNQLGQSEAALSGFRALIERSEEAEEAGLELFVNQARLSLGWLSARSGEHRAAINIFDSLAERLRGRQDTESLDLAAHALRSTAESWKSLDDIRAEIAAYDAIAGLLRDRPEPALHVHLARSLYNKGRALRRLGDRMAELEAYDRLITRFAEAKAGDVLESVAWALLHKGHTQVETGDIQAGVETLETLIFKFANATEPKLRRAALIAQFGVAAASEPEDDAVRLSALDRFLEQAGRETDKEHVVPDHLVAIALVQRAVVFMRQGHEERAILSFNEAITRFQGHKDKRIAQAMLVAFESTGDIYERRGRLAEAIVSYERAGTIPIAALDDELVKRQQSSRIRLANMLLDQGDFVLAEQHFVAVQDEQPILAKSNLAWLYLLTNRLGDAARLREELVKLQRCGRELLDAGIELSRGNFGLATEHLSEALQGDLAADGVSFEDDLNRLLRLANHLGHGETLIAWFETNGYADRAAPLVAAFKALVRGERTLLDVNPEVSGPARAILARLDAPRRNAATPLKRGKSKSRGRTRQRKSRD